MKNFWNTNKVGKPSVNQHLVLEFLEYKGYRNTKLNNQWRIVKFDNHIIDFVDDTIEVRQFLINHIKSCGDFFGREGIMDQTLELFKNVKRNGLLDGLSMTELNLIENSQGTSYKFFHNVVVEITPDSISFLSYKDLKGNVLRSSIIEKALYETDEELIWDSDFPNFLYRCMNLDESKFHSLMRILGYLSSEFKSRKDDQAIIFCDGLLDGLPDGGTGKSLTAMALSYFNNTVIEDGKNFKYTNFTFQQVTFGTRLLIIDDANKKLNFENLFSSITNGFQIEKKYQDKYTLSFEDSPKILITTNYTIYGKGYSFDRRIIEVEFSDYYGRTRKPLDDFKKEFFESWDNKEWSLFYNFMLRCVQHYLKSDKIEDVSINDPIKKRLMRETSSDFIEFITDFDFVNLIKKADLFALFIEEFPEYSKWLSIRKFNEWVKNYCKTLRIDFIESKKDGGQRCWTFNH